MNVVRKGSPDAIRRRGVLAARRDRPRARRAGAIAQRKPARPPPALAAGNTGNTGNTGASRRPRHHFDCVQNSESAQGLQDTVPHRPGRELHPHMRTCARCKEYRRACMRARRAGRGNDAAREARCDIGAQGAGGEQTGGRARSETRPRKRIGAITRRGGVLGWGTPGPVRTASGASRGADDEEGGLHGAGRTWRNHGAPASVGAFHREPLPCDLLHVGG